MLPPSLLTRFVTHHVLRGVSRHRVVRGFTLIEVIIALVVFGMGVVVLLRALIFFIGTSDDLKAQAQATLLAKEAVDIVLQQRDTNLLRGVRWDCARIQYASLQGQTSGDLCDVVMTTGMTYIVASIATGGYQISPISQTGDSAMVSTPFLSGSHMTHRSFLSPNSASSASRFERIVQFFPATMQGNLLSPQHVLRLVVTVGYAEGGVMNTRRVVLDTLLAAGEKVQ